MPARDALKIKENIISAIRIRGPILPVHIAKEAGLSILFAGAFLSELVAEKKLRISHMKVGGSPIYYLPEQEPQLEKFSDHLNSKEKDAFFLLKEKKFLLDREQHPAIRVALRAIKDFAAPFERQDSLYWKYYTTPENEFVFEEKEVIKKPEKEPVTIIHTITSPPTIESSQLIPIKQTTIEPRELEQKELGIFDSEKEIKEVIKKEKTKKIKITKPKKHQTLSPKKDDKFFDKVKEFLSKKGMEISDIKSFSKNELVLIVKNKSKESLLVAYNKKKLTEDDIIKAHKKSQDLGLPYLIFSLGEPAKKTSNLIEALKNLSGWEKVE